MKKLHLAFACGLGLCALLSQDVLAAAFDPAAAVRADLEQRLAARGLVASDVADFAITSVVPTKHNGLTHVYVRQRVNGLEVLGAEMNFNLTRHGGVLSPGGSFVAEVAAKADRTLREPAFTADDAVIAAAAALGEGAVDRLALVESVGGVERRATFANPALSRLPIPTRLAYLRLPGSDELRLVWNVTIQSVRSSDWWDAQIDAETGELLKKVNWTESETYGVYASPAESPDRTVPAATRTDVVDPYTDGGGTLPSPFGWHDTNGAAGPEFTTTRGNNVRACDDINNDNDCSTSLEPSQASLLFDIANFAIDLATEDPAAYTDVAVINLFYWNNIMHDVTHRYGFDEAAGNFQVNNYGNGGLGNDAVNADAQDGSGTNNANFGTPPDGFEPRMQMFRWTYPYVNRLTVNSPATIDGDYQISVANFGPAVSTPITGDLLMAIDGAGANTNDACEALTNGGAMAGKIAMMYRGNCNFTVKVKNAQLAGAIAAVIINNIPNPPGALGGTDGTITISSGMISQADGVIIVAELATPVNATLQPVGGSAPPTRDSDLDAGVIAHEYGHGISNRLTGGPANVSCVTGNERMGEGWSDWMTLFLHAEAGDTEATTRAVGTYLTYEARSGFGIRRFPYSTNLAVNPLKYGDIDDPLNTIPHGVGAIWANMLWEMYWNLVDEYGYDSDIYTGTGGNNVAFQLVMDGMKLQPCNPGFVDGRNAILLADKIDNCGANQCRIWDAFAKRGVGVGATQGSSAVVGDEVPTEVLPPGCPNQVFYGDFETQDTACWSSTTP